MAWRLGRKPKLSIASAAGQPAALFVVIEERHDLWKRQYSFWKSVGYGLGFVGFVAAVLSAALPSMIGADHPVLFPALSAGAAVIVGFVAFAAPVDQARAYIAAWKGLDREINKYLHDPRPKQMENILKAVEVGENVIAGRVPF